MIERKFPIPLDFSDDFWPGAYRIPIKDWQTLCKAVGIDVHNEVALVHTSEVIAIHRLYKRDFKATKPSEECRKWLSKLKKATTKLRQCLEKDGNSLRLLEGIFEQVKRSSEAQSDKETFIGDVHTKLGMLQFIIACAEFGVPEIKEKMHGKKFTYERTIRALTEVWTGTINGRVSMSRNETASEILIPPFVEFIRRCLAIADGKDNYAALAKRPSLAKRIERAISK